MGDAGAPQGLSDAAGRPAAGRHVEGFPLSFLRHGGRPEARVPRFNAQGWAVVGISFAALALAYGARSTVGILMPIWELELGWSRTLSSGGSSLVLAMMALASPFAGNLIDRHGPRYVFVCSLVVVGGVMVAMGGVVEEWQFLALFGLIGGVGMGALSVPLVSTATALYFTRNRGLVTSIAMSGATGGQLPVLTALGFMIATLGWRQTYFWYGLALLALAPAAFVLIRRRADRIAVGPVGTSGAARRSLGARVGILFRDRSFLLLLGAFTLCGFTTAGVIDVHFVPYVASSGFKLVDGTAAYGVHGLFNMFGLLLAGWLSDRVNRPRLLAGIYFARALSFVLLLYIAADISLMYVFAAIFGLLNFSVLPIVASIVASHIGIRVMGLTMGLLFAGHSLGGAFGALLGGAVYDLSGSYDWVWIVSIALAFLASVFAYLIPERRGISPEPSAPSLPA